MRNTSKVTLVMGSEEGYINGALALGQSIIDVQSKLVRVAMVTNDVPSEVIVKKTYS